MNYEQDIKIDESALDIECLEQSTLMMKYCRHQAQTQKDEDLAKEKLELVKAELDKEIRNNPDKFDIPKITESVVQSTILTDKRHKMTSEAYINAKFENNVAKGAVRALDQRKNMLEGLIRLNGQQYFAGPSVPRDLTSEAEQRRKQQNVDSKITIRRRRKNANTID